MTPSPATLRACKLAERAYQRAARRNEPAARAARLAAVHAAIADGWTQQRIADAMGKSRGWVGQRAPKAARVAADGPSAPSIGDRIRADADTIDAKLGGPSIGTRLDREIAARYDALATTTPQNPAPIPVRALDRFRRTDR